MSHAVQTQRQLTIRGAITGMILGGVLSLSNVYVALKTGWSLGVTITASILGFSIFTVLTKTRIVRKPFGMLENNAMKSVASSAGYMTGGGTIAAIPAFMMITGTTMDGWQMFAWISVIGLLGLFVAIPMKQQMINVEQLKFPTGTATAETLKALYGADKEGGNKKARLLGLSSLVGALVGFFRDAQAKWMPFNIPDKIPVIPGLQLFGRPLVDYTVSFEGSLIMLGAGAIMGWRAAWSLLLGAILNFAILAPLLYKYGIIDAKLGFKSIVAWSVWPGAGLLLTSGILSFAFQWRSIARAIKDMTGTVSKKVVSTVSSADLPIEVPMRWFFIGIIGLTPIMVFLEWFIFGIRPWMGVLSVILGFFIAIVATRVTGETDTTPTSALGKITQVTFGALDPGNMVTNLMTANVTGGMGLHSADLLTDLKSGYILKADPRQQFFAQFIGVLAGSCFVVPAYRLLIPTADVLGTNQWPAPAAFAWKGVAELLAKGFHTLHPTAQLALLVGGLLGIVLVLLEKFLPKYKKFIPSPAAFGLASITPAFNCISMFVGALITFFLERKRPALAETTVIPVASGFIAGESLMGVLIALLVVMGFLG